MKTKHRFLLIAALLFSAIGLKAQEAAYDHKIIAVLPIWNFEREIDGSYNRDKKQNARLFRSFIKKFPYTR